MLLILFKNVPDTSKVESFGESDMGAVTILVSTSDIGDKQTTSDL